MVLFKKIDRPIGFNFVGYRQKKTNLPEIGKLVLIYVINKIKLLQTAKSLQRFEENRSDMLCNCLHNLPNLRKKSNMKTIILNFYILNRYEQACI